MSLSDANLISVAKGNKPTDLVLIKAKIVNVFTVKLIMVVWLFIVNKLLVSAIIPIYRKLARSLAFNET